MFTAAKPVTPTAATSATRLAATRFGYTAASDRLGWGAPVYVADTDEQAIEEARAHMEALFNVFIPKSSELMFLPPGYMSEASMKQVMVSKRANRGVGVDIEDLNARGVVVCGSPETVRRRIAQVHQRVGFQEFIAILQFGTLPADLTEKNIRMFAAEVMPRVEGLTVRLAPAAPPR